MGRPTSLRLITWRCRTRPSTSRARSAGAACRPRRRTTRPCRTSGARGPRGRAQRRRAPRTPDRGELRPSGHRPRERGVARLVGGDAPERPPQRSLGGVGGLPRQHQSAERHVYATLDRVLAGDGLQGLRRGAAKARRRDGRAVAPGDARHRPRVRPRRAPSAGAARRSAGGAPCAASSSCIRRNAWTAAASSWAMRARYPPRSVGAPDGRAGRRPRGLLPPPPRHIGQLIVTAPLGVGA